MLVPLKPNELTPAIRLPLSRFHEVVTVGTLIAKPPQSICGFSSFKCRVGGIFPCCSARMALIRPAIPAADSACPKLLFTEPTRSERSEPRPWPKTSASARASIGSPSEVPVPWASMKSMSPGLKSGVGQRLADDCYLRGAVRSGQAAAAAVLVARPCHGSVPGCCHRRRARRTSASTTRCRNLRCGQNRLLPHRRAYTDRQAPSCATWTR